MSDMTDDTETLRRKNARLQVALSEANAVREACAQRAFRLEAEVERLREEIDALRADAERYRWLRNSRGTSEIDASIDAAIDEAMKQAALRREESP